MSLLVYEIYEWLSSPVGYPVENYWCRVINVFITSDLRTSFYVGSVIVFDPTDS